MVEGLPVTKLPLATWARIAGFNPLHFWGVAFHPSNQTAPSCEGALSSFNWQNNDALSRYEIAQAIQEAEQMIEERLKFHLIPTWDKDEWRPTAQSNRPELTWPNSFNFRRNASSVVANWGNVLSGGTEAYTLMDAASPITWSDEDGDGYFETATVMAIMPTGAVSCEVEVFYPGHTGDPAWQVRPTTVTVVGDDATITFRRELVVAEERLFGLETQVAEPDDDTHFLSTVDVYRHWNDPSNQGDVLWAPFSVCGSCFGGGCTLCAYTTQQVCLHLLSTPRNGVLGWSIGYWDTTTRLFVPTDQQITRQPDIVRLRYYSGLVTARGCEREMDPHWARVVTMLSMSLLQRSPCDCTTDTGEMWREDTAVVRGGEQGKVFARRSKKDYSEFGTRLGAIQAWKQVCAPDVARVSTANLV